MERIQVPYKRSFSIDVDQIQVAEDIDDEAADLERSSQINHLESEQSKNRKLPLQLSKCHCIALSVNVSVVYVALGLLISLQPPFYPSEVRIQWQNCAY